MRTTEQLVCGLPDVLPLWVSFSTIGTVLAKMELWWFSLGTIRASVVHPLQKHESSWRAREKGSKRIGCETLDVRTSMETCCQPISAGCRGNVWTENCLALKVLKCANCTSYMNCLEDIQIFTHAQNPMHKTCRPEVSFVRGIQYTGRALSCSLVVDSVDTLPSLLHAEVEIGDADQALPAF